MTFYEVVRWDRLRFVSDSGREADSSQVHGSVPSCDEGPLCTAWRGTGRRRGAARRRSLTVEAVGHDWQESRSCDSILSVSLTREKVSSRRHSLDTASPETQFALCATEYERENVWSLSCW